jgi:NAD-dependent deacetylase
VADAVLAARLAVRAATRIVVFTGAGVSAESGIPTFRDALTGLWARYEPERLATEEGFAADPPLVWRWYASRRAAVRACAPNAAHHAIARLQARTATTVVTQNVDGLHARAGTVDPVELHGNIVRAKCFAGCGWIDDADALEAADARVPPHCPRCGAYARPDVVWFGEMLPVAAWARAEAACRDADLCLVVGTSGLVYPAAGLPALAKEGGAVIIVVGPEPAPQDEFADFVLRGRAGEVLPAVLG